MNFDLTDSYFSKPLSDITKYPMISQPQSNDFFGSISKGFDSAVHSFGDIMSDANDHFNKYSGLYNFAGNAAAGIGNYVMQNRTANEAKKMNNYYKSMYDRQMKNEDEAKKSFQYGFQLSNANKPTYS